MKTGTFAATAALLALASCSDMALSVVCPAEPAPALAISVMHPDTRQPLTASASGWFAVGARQDSLQFQGTGGGDGMLLARGNAGSYRVEVRVPGHALWTEEAIGVQEDACGVRTVRIVASPAPAP